MKSSSRQEGLLEKVARLERKLAERSRFPQKEYPQETRHEEPEGQPQILPAFPL
jgi:hypothetical protein